MNELRPCSPLSLKNVLAQEAVSDSLLRYNTTRMLRENESALFIKLCRAFVEVAFTHCVKCFGRCYPGGAALVSDAKNFRWNWPTVSIVAVKRTTETCSQCRDQYYNGEW